MVYRQTPRSEKVRAAAKARILRSAKKLFGERGYDQTTMQDVVRDAKTSIGNAYFYFSNKGDILTCLLEEAVYETWARADEVLASVEPGAARIAVAVYANIMNFLTADKDMALMAVTGEPSVVRHILGMHSERLIALFIANFPDRGEKELLMTAVAVGGANRTAIELFLTGQLDVDPRELADFLVRWHLRAFNLPKPEIDRVLRIAVRTIKPGPASRRSPAGRKTGRTKAFTF
ncbi:MAG TPA: helix-turn-helix domain-containing protein [Gemmatimonadaceae bacterium]|nr:helix-turn-helix domain-containing protein [Gemmatimonadaceae bacterium]